jgi:hypothetical protein
MTDNHSKDNSRTSEVVGRTSPDEQALYFKQRKYVILRRLLNEPEVSLYHNRAIMLLRSGRMRPDRQVPNTPASYGEMDSLLTKLLPQAEKTSGLRLYPTYSYFRVYKSGDILKKHVDRPACEISLSLNLGSKSTSAWPLWIATPTDNVSVELEAGDAVMYRGRECLHWREPFTGEEAVQVFLHYVDQTGPYAEWKFDKRKSSRLSTGVWSKRRVLILI